MAQGSTLSRYPTVRNLTDSPILMGKPVHCSSFMTASPVGSYTDSGIQSDFSSPTSLDEPRPNCIGQEHELTLGTTIVSIDYSERDIRSILGDSTTDCKSCKLLGSETLDTDWDNSELDATCSTCYNVGNDTQQQSDREVRHLVFFTHMKQCQECQNGEMCEIAFELEADISSFIELETDSVLADNMKPLTTCLPRVPSIFDMDLSERNISKFNSGSSVPDSDKSEFMRKPMNKVAVTHPYVNNMDKNTKKKLTSKLKSFRKYVHKLGKGSQMECYNSEFRTLALI